MDRQSATTNRACESCKRKKTKCDGKKPTCSLCFRIRTSCVYPQRKSRVRDRLRSISTIPDEISTGNSEGDSHFLSDPNQNLEQCTENHDADFNGDGVGWGSLTSTLGTEAAFNPSPTDQDMLDFLAQTVPDIWMTETLPQYTMQSSMPAGSCDERMLPVSTERSTPRILIAANGQDQLQSPDFTGTETSPLRGHEENTSLNVPPEVVDELIELYFQRIQVFLPLFHRPRFEQSYLGRNSDTRYTNLTIDRAYMFYGMLALSARFSSSSYFGDMNPKERGSQFARQAQAICHKMVQDAIPHSPSLVWLQGHILLAYYNQACRLALGYDLMVATCIRFAYDLGLHRIDEDEPDSEDSEQWVGKEGQRRAWWCVWELDAFDSISSRHPFTINWNRVFVFLPVSDEAWFSNTPVRSAMLNSDILQCWKALRDSPNQDERAWFLISNFILAQALELCQQRHVSLKSINDIETVVSCFSLLFHEKFRSSVNNPTFDDNTYGKSNWTILTRLMVQSTRIATCMLISRSSSDPILTPLNRFDDKASPGIEQPRKPTSSSPARIESYSQPASEVFRIYQSWSPSFIGFAPPTMVSIITGPAAIMLRFARHMRKEQNGGDTSQSSIQEDLLVLILRHFAHYWNIGLFLLDFVKAFREG